MLVLPHTGIRTRGAVARPSPTEYCVLRAGLSTECEAFYNPRQYARAGGTTITRAAGVEVRLLGGALKSRKSAHKSEDGAPDVWGITISSDLGAAASEKQRSHWGRDGSQGHNPGSAENFVRSSSCAFKAEQESKH